MRNSIAMVVFLVVGALLVPSHTQAQGGMIEWFNKLSGPEGEILLFFWDFCSDQEGELDKFIKRKKPSADRAEATRLADDYLWCWQDGWSTRVGFGWGFDLDSPSGVAGGLDLAIFEPMRVWRREADTGNGWWKPDSYGVGLTLWHFEASGPDLFRYGLIAQATYAIRLGSTSKWFLDLGPIVRLYNGGFDAEDFARTSSNSPELNWGLYVGLTHSVGNKRIRDAVVATF